MPTLDRTADPRTDLRKLEALFLVEGWWERAGLEERWPLSTADAATFLRDGGKFDVDPGRLLDLVARRLMPSPAVELDQFEWSAADVIEAGGTLEARRQFLPFPCPEHDAKKTPEQIALEQARAGGLVAHIGVGPDRPRFDVPHLLALVLGSDSFEIRAKLVAQLKATLEVEHGVYLP